MTKSDKLSLSHATHLPLSKIDSDMTNFRRRSGWNDVLRDHCKGSKEKMETLVLTLESGGKVPAGFAEGMDRVKAYLERREEEKLGSWVEEVSVSSLKREMR